MLWFRQDSSAFCKEWALHATHRLNMVDIYGKLFENP